MCSDSILPATQGCCAADSSVSMLSVMLPAVLCTLHLQVRTIQAGWSCHWRLVYLLQSGQAHSVSLLTALRISHQKFLTAFPDYLLWLHRWFFFQRTS